MKKAKTIGWIIKNQNEGKTLYYQHIKKGGFWTKFLVNAMVFYNKEAAIKVAQRFKYGVTTLVELKEEECLF